MNEFLKRLGLTVLYLLGSAYAISYVMSIDRGYRGNWLFILTGKIAWGIEMVVKIAFLSALAGAAMFVVVKVLALFETMKNEADEEALKRNNETVAEANRAAWMAELRTRNANSIEEIGLQKRKAREHEDHLEQLEAKRTGPRSEDDALEKALSGIKSGGLE